MSGDSQRQNKKKGILLDIGCGEIARNNFVRMDKRPLKGIDIVHDLEVFPYPIENDICITIIASHVVEHIKPWLMIEFMDELWRIAKLNAGLAISMPYGYSDGFLQDPTHCNACNFATWQYFDPRFPLYNVYKPKTWEIADGFPQYQANGNMEVLMAKKHAEKVKSSKEETDKKG